MFSHLSKLSHRNVRFCARAEIEHVIATIFQPGGRSEISARAEIHHVILPLMVNKFKLTVVHVTHPNPIVQICACAWSYRWTNICGKSRLGRGPPGCRGSWAAGLLLAKPLLYNTIRPVFYEMPFFSFSRYDLKRLYRVSNLYSIEYNANSVKNKKTLRLRTSV